MIDLGIRSDQLYVAVKLEIEFLRPDASPPFVEGTSFVVVDADQPLAVVATTRHLLDPGFKPAGVSRHAEPVPGLPADIVAYHAFSRSGSSGSPVIAPARGIRVDGGISLESPGWRSPDRWRERWSPEPR